MVAALTFLGVLLALLVVSAVLVVGMYNRLVTLRNRFKNAFSQIDVQLKRRYDLIPNLVETAKAYMNHERETLEAVMAARNQAVRAEQRVAMDPSDGASVRALMGAEGALTGAMGRLFAVMEAYPNLTADQNMRQLSEELTSTENKIAFARQAYNDAVMIYNTQCEKFPSNLIAGMFNFDGAEPFEVDSAQERQAPQVSFS